MYAVSNAFFRRLRHTRLSTRARAILIDHFFLPDKCLHTQHRAVKTGAEQGG